ncbi:MAG: hypothetical protein GFH27_549411n43 [Chloroflexi bacterium AL-W]|nr:hypothetical protein [Chloroflexi bacterium AL-W]
MTQFLTVYLWFPLVALLAFIYLIARFFERFSGQRTFANGFLIVGIIFGVALVRYASMGGASSDVIADVLFGLSGIITAFLSLRLLWLMALRQNKEHTGLA